MKMVAILVMWHGRDKQTFIPPIHWGSIWNLALIGQVVSEKKTFEECGWWMDGRACLYYMLTYKPKGSGWLINVKADWRLTEVNVELRDQCD